MDFDPSAEVSSGYASFAQSGTHRRQMASGILIVMTMMMLNFAVPDK
jgi:hypothetical protein